MKLHLLAPALFCALLLEAPAQAQSLPRIGIDGGLFFPSSSKTKEVFGSSFKSIGPGFGSTQVFRRRIYPDIDLIREEKSDNKATVVFAGARLLVPLGRPLVSEATTGFAPYAGLGLNLIYADIDAPTVGVEDKGFGVGASATVGASFGGRFFSEARYRVATETAEFNFSGTQVVIGVRF